MLKDLRILLVEEEALIAMDIEQLCYEHGASRVVTVDTEAKLAPDALASAADLSAVDAAILDARIGEGWTWALARSLEKRRIPFVFATGYSATEPFFERFPEIPVITKPSN